MRDFRASTIVDIQEYTEAHELIEIDPDPSNMMCNIPSPEALLQRSLPAFDPLPELEEPISLLPNPMSQAYILDYTDPFMPQIEALQASETPPSTY